MISRSRVVFVFVFYCTLKSICKGYYSFGLYVFRTYVLNDFALLHRYTAVFCH